MDKLIENLQHDMLNESPFDATGMLQGDINHLMQDNQFLRLNSLDKFDDQLFAINAAEPVIIDTRSTHARRRKGQPQKLVFDLDDTGAVPNLTNSSELCVDHSFDLVVKTIGQPTIESDIDTSGVSPSTSDLTDEFTCDCCGAAFPTKSKLRSHCRTHGDKKADLKCKICG